MHDVENNIILLFIFMLCGMFMFARVFGMNYAKTLMKSVTNRLEQR